jgi:hypothetical protein
MRMILTVSDKLVASEFTLGAEGSVAAGPLGRTATAQTGARMHAGILCCRDLRDCLPVLKYSARERALTARVSGN